MRPRFAGLLIALMLIGAVHASTALTLTAAVEHAVEVSADALTARNNLAAAERALARVTADPLALRLDQLQAQQSVESAQVALEVTLLRVRAETTSAFTTVLEADEALELARSYHDIASATLEAQRVRFEAGAITQLDLERTRNDQETAARDLANDQVARDLAYAELSSKVGFAVADATAIPDDLPSPPPFDELLVLALQQNAQVRATKRNAQLAAVRLETVDNPFSTRADIESAREALDSAHTQVDETRRVLELSLLSAYNAVLAAQARVDGATANQHTAYTELATQRLRLEAGSLSPMAFRQAELSYANTLASLNSARYAYLAALLRLEQAVAGQ